MAFLRANGHGLRLFAFDLYPHVPVVRAALCRGVSQAVLRAEFAGDLAPQWVPLDRVPELPLWPKHLKWLCRRLLAGEALTYIPAFLNDIESPWTELDVDPFAPAG